MVEFPVNMFNMIIINDKSNHRSRGFDTFIQETNPVTVTVSCSLCWNAFE
jgi:hypothetical protein